MKDNNALIIYYNLHSLTIYIYIIINVQFLQQAIVMGTLITYLVDVYSIEKNYLGYHISEIEPMFFLRKSLNQSLKIIEFTYFWNILNTLHMIYI